MSTKIHAAVDVLGNPIRLLLTAGQASEYGQARALLDGFQTDYVCADKDDSNDFILAIEERRGCARYSA